VSRPCTLKNPGALFPVLDDDKPHFQLCETWIDIFLHSNETMLKNAALLYLIYNRIKGSGDFLPTGGKHEKAYQNYLGVQLANFSSRNCDNN